MWTIGVLVFSLGVGVKMSLLLALPGVVMVLGQALETGRVLSLGGLMFQVQASFPFLRNLWGWYFDANAGSSGPLGYPIPS